MHKDNRKEKLLSMWEDIFNNSICDVNLRINLETDNTEEYYDKLYYDYELIGDIEWH